MGLFKNNKKQCPICGDATPRLLATKVEGMPICSACADKMDIRQELMNSLTVDQLKDYMAFYETNQPLKQEFKADYEKKTGFMQLTAFRCDYEHKTFRLKTLENAIVYQPEHFVKLEVFEGKNKVITLTKNELHIYKSTVPDFIRSLEKEIDQFNSKVQIKDAYVDAQKELRHDEAMRKAREAGEIWNEYEYQQKERELERQKEYQNQNNTPSFKPSMPFNEWKIVLTISHDWGEGIVDTDKQTWFKEERPSVQEGLDAYNKSLKKYIKLAKAFRKVCCPKAKILDESELAADAGGKAETKKETTTAAKPATAASAADEIKKFKELLDQGIITQEEFDAKKKQLLGI